MTPKDHRPRGPLASTPQGRSIQISKALSWLLRHGAAKERMAIDKSGYVNLQDVLSWHKLRILNASFEEVIACVQDNEKQRFGLKWNLADPSLDPKDGTDSKIAEAKGKTPHQSALAHIEAADAPNAKDYSIRAVQGHSLKTIEATTLLSPITLEKQNIPSTCVHGTFFASWPTILKSGGLKAMTRNHVHFASGPNVSDILPNTGEDAEAVIDAAGMDNVIETRDQKINLKAAMQKSEVVSGMRGDAQVLIYIDVKRSIEEGKMEWWKSDNGVILTEGIKTVEKQLSEVEETAIVLGKTRIGDKGEKTVDDQIRPSNERANDQQGPASKAQKLVPMIYWDTVVGIGVGILWSQEKGVVQDIPASLLQGGRKNFAENGKAKPQLRNRGKGSEKPKVKVERDEMEGFG